MEYSKYEQERIDLAFGYQKIFDSLTDLVAIKTDKENIIRILERTKDCINYLITEVNKKGEQKNG